MTWRAIRMSQFTRGCLACGGIYLVQIVEEVNGFQDEGVERTCICSVFLGIPCDKSCAVVVWWVSIDERCLLGWMVLIHVVCVMVWVRFRYYEDVSYGGGRGALKVLVVWHGE